MPGYMGLIIDAIFLRVYPRSDIKRKERPRALAQSRRILPHSDGMQIYHTVETLVLVAESHPVLQRSQVVSKSQVTCRLHTAEQYLDRKSVV